MVRYDAEQSADLLLTLRDVTEERRLARIKSDFVSNASHELRTPLTNIRGYLEAMQDAQREGAAADPSFLSIAHANALRMDRLIEDLLELSRAESGESPIATEEVPIADFLQRVAGLHRDAAARAGKTVTVTAENAVLKADLGKLASAVSNLVDNAIKYGRDGGRIALEGRVEERAYVIEVSDDGPGIPPEHLPRIFERFYRVDKGRSRDLGGTGLGLSIARHIVESHGGTIRVESRIGAGTRFVIRIPG
jgi:two-component system phosphate regulon sensor histidine kinase PhoR